jgi:ribosomal protein S18 acetylase RimI-like enzyme
MQVRVRTIAASETHDLRRRVLRDGDAKAVVVWPRDDEPTTTHYGACDASGRIVAIGTIYAQALAENAGDRAVTVGVAVERQFQFRGMASDASVRGSGAGKAVLDALIAHARREAPAVLWCNARVAAIGFYARAGMQIVSERFEIAGVGPHHVMAMRLA